MDVKELIAELQKLPPETPVRVSVEGAHPTGAHPPRLYGALLGALNAVELHALEEPQVYLISRDNS